EETVYLAGVAQSHHYLAMLAGRQLAMERALPHFEQAIAFYEHVGDRVNREIVRGNLASAYIQSRRFPEALAPAGLALHFFQAMGNPFRTAQNASNLAEAHAELGNLDQAEQNGDSGRVPDTAHRDDRGNADQADCPGLQRDVEKVCEMLG
ncbi:MAG TPA: hypothetical protein PKE45_13345, partial [Caldilineaceae bacterium]|nr:hypothetical protein [Caldilineaceae bacterium]